MFSTLAFIHLDALGQQEAAADLPDSSFYVRKTGRGLHESWGGSCLADI